MGEKNPRSKAFAVFERHARELRRFLARRVPRKEDADELAQEVFLRILRSDTAAAAQNPRAYVFTVATHVVADFKLAARRDESHVIIDTEAMEQSAEYPPNWAPDELADRLNLQQQVQRVLKQLPPLYAAILVMHKCDGLSYQEVAEKLRISDQTVKKYLARAKAHFRMVSWDR